MQEFVITLKFIYAQYSNAWYFYTFRIFQENAELFITFKHTLLQ